MPNDMLESSVSKITGKSLDECKELLFKEFGDKYVVTNLSTVVLNTGFLGLFPKPGVEVSYTIKKNSDFLKPSASDEWAKNRSEILKNAGSSLSSIKQFSALDKKIDDISNILENKVLTKLSSGMGSPKSQSITNIENLLEENEFTKDYIQNISKKISSEFSLDELDNQKLVERKVIDWIGESIQIAPKRAFRPPHVIVIVGPTGVGKTTTIAKLAAQQIVEAQKANLTKPVIRMITVDKTRVAAEEQLKHYGEVMGLQVDKAESTDDVKKLYDDCKNSCDVLLIDTSGYSPNDSENIGKMKKILSVDSLNADIYLAISASTKARDLVNILQNYEPFGYTSIIITKCDETNQYGNVISILSDKRKPISYITDGQGVARNIKRAEVIDFLLHLNNFEVDRTHIEDLFGDNDGRTDE